MKFLCSNCKAKYQIADEKVAGRTLRMTCRQCRQEIVIRGDTPALGLPAAPAALGRLPAPPQPAGQPSALGRDFQQQVRGEAMRASVTPPPALDAWHVAINDQPVGPIGRDEVARKLASGVLDGESLAWREGLDDWLPIRTIPELARLAPAIVAPAPAPMPSAPVVPAQRADVAPIGGRAGAAPAFSFEDWAPPPATEPSGLHKSGLHAMPAATPAAATAPAEPRGQRTPPWGVMFAIACGFALLMSALTIFGARWLSQPEPQAAVTPPPAAPSAPAEPELELPEPSEEEGMVIELDEVGLEGETRTGTRRPSGGSRSAETSSGSADGASKPSAPKRELTDAEKAMLARMGGGTDTKLAKLGSTEGNTASRSTAREGGLTAQELSKVVMQGRKNLQRCYESALRGTGSDETVRVDVEITVSAAGNVTQVKTSDGGLPGMQQCIQRTVKMWRFPSSGDSTTTKFPLVFQPGA